MQLCPKERKPVQLRSIATLLADHQKFSQNGKDKGVRFFNNVVGEPFFNIPLTQVCITVCMLLK